MQTQFTASQTVTIPLTERGASIEDYLQDPRRIVNALTDSSQVTLLEPGLFRFSLRALSFMTLELRPTADLQLWSPAPGQVRIKALSCWLEGAEHLNRHFSMTMEGYLNSDRVGPQVNILGSAQLHVKVDLPLPFSLTPRPIIEAAGNALLGGILATIQRRLKQQLKADYYAWAAQHAAVKTLS